MGRTRQGVYTTFCGKVTSVPESRVRWGSVGRRNRIGKDAERRQSTEVWESENEHSRLQCQMGRRSVLSFVHSFIQHEFIEHLLSPGPVQTLEVQTYVPPL